MLGLCRSIGCVNPVTSSEDDFCDACQKYAAPAVNPDPIEEEDVTESSLSPMAQKYPKYYKPVGNLTEVDVYAVHHLFNIQDPSGAIQHASKKLLLSGVRTGGKSKYDDVREARDTLTRWMQLHDDTQ